jgi:hypothetical protein
MDSLLINIPANIFGRTKGLMLARQVLYHLSPPASIFAVLNFIWKPGMVVHTCCPTA